MNKNIYAISVVMPAYNAGETILDSLKSLEKQTLSKQNFEVIIIDDGSIDETLKIIKNYKTNMQLKFFSQENKGVASARNLALKYIKNNFIYFLDADDEISEDTLFKCVEKHKEGFSIVRTPWNRGNINGIGGVSIKNNNILFNENLRVAEDLIYLFENMTKIDKQEMILVDSLYKYRDSEEGLNNSGKIIIPDEIIFLKEIMKLFLGNKLEFFAFNNREKIFQTLISNILRVKCFGNVDVKNIKRFKKFLYSNLSKKDVFKYKMMFTFKFIYKIIIKYIYKYEVKYDRN